MSFKFQPNLASLNSREADAMRGGLFRPKSVWLYFCAATGARCGQFMPHWLIKSAIHRVIACLPASRKWNEWFQVRVTKSLELGPGGFEGKMKETRRFLEEFLALRPECADGFTALELGTGWYPAVPIGLWLCGAREIWSFDIEPLLRRERLNALLNYFLKFDATGALRDWLPQVKPERIEMLRAALKESERETSEAVLARFNIHAMVRDTRNTGLESGTIDLFFSNAVLEYVPAEVQAGLFAEFHRLGRPGAVVVQFINLKDQYWNFDPSITPFNYLKYSKKMWRWLDSPLIPQTRLRIADYRALLTAGGFEVVKEDNKSGSAADLDKIQLAPEFQKYSQEDLLVMETWQVARRK